MTCLMRMMNKMKVKRNIEIETEEFKVGDIIAIIMKDYKIVDFMAVKQEDTKTLFMACDCWNDSEKYTLKAFKENKVLEKEILPLFPENIRKRMLPFSNGKYLRLPRPEEIWGEEEVPGSKNLQFKPMQDFRNRVGFGPKGGVVGWWLEPPSCNPCFAETPWGYSDICLATYCYPETTFEYPRGIRFIFQLDNNN